ncbi:DUF1801 domain-containing protein [Candidatus Saccharibacteria bacterium]|nr:DUF1801 domain-containing protein [Candidatus Saccharibacteria bacterium]
MKADTTIIDEYFSGTGDREADLRRVYHAVCAAVPRLEPFLFDSGSIEMVSWGMFHQRYASGREVEWPLIGLANQKNYISLYICAVKDGQYLPERYGERLGKVNNGKSCIRFRSADDLNMTELRHMLHEAGAWLKSQSR